MEQNAQLNLFMAENERNRIGHDLHDSLGHTFAMLSVKAELAQQFYRWKLTTRRQRTAGNARD